MIMLDLHVHTSYSGDATINPKQIVEQLHAHPFIKGVAITDHDTIEGYFQAKKLAKPYKDILIMPGIEISTKQGHLTILGIEEKPKYPITIEEAADFARQKEGLIIIPHPYRELGLGDLTENVEADAIETLNPRATPKENRKASNLAKMKKLPGVAGSDAHTLQQLWKVYTEVDAQTGIDEVLHVIKKGLIKVASIKMQI